MTRYQALRSLGFDIFSSAIVSFLNFMWNIPDGKIGFMNVVINYDHTAKKTKNTKAYLEVDK